MYPPPLEDLWSFKFLRMGDPEYEAARRASVWNGRVPERYPSLIVYPECSQDVQAVVRYAKANNISVGTKSGGHSWTASFLRDEGILVDLVKMNAYTVDIETCTATAQPAAYGSDLNADLVNHNLMFPAGHCPTVGLGGYLLQGGFGWNSRKWGLGCESVLAVELVNAEGDLLRASPTQNTDYYWAARGAGCGFFGVITMFTLKLWPLPPVIMTSRYVFDIRDFDEVVVSLDDISKSFPLDLEVSAFVGRGQDGYTEATVAITADALSDSRSEALYGLQMVHHLPAIKKSLKTNPFVVCTLKDMLRRFDDLLDNRGRRYEANNLWTDARAQTMLQGFDRIIQNIPPSPSHLYLLWWVPKKSRSDMAFSLEGNLYVALYGIGTDPNEDAKHSDFVVDNLEHMEPYRKGIQLADENLPLHPGKFMQLQNYRRLEVLRRKYDGQGKFYSYMRVPPEYEQEQH